MPVLSFAVEVDAKEAAHASVEELMRRLPAVSDGEEMLLHKNGDVLEVFGASERPEEWVTAVSEVLSQALPSSSRPTRRLDGPKAARRFLLRLAGIQDSGLPEQPDFAFRQSFQVARSLDRVGPKLSWLYQRGLWLAEKVRIESNAARNALTPESVVVQLAEKIFGSLRNQTALVVAKNNACEALVNQLRDRGLGNLLFADLHGGAWRQVCERFRGQVVARRELEPVLQTADLVLLFDDQMEELLDAQQVTKLLQRRKKGPALWVTLFESTNHLELTQDSLPNVYCYNLNDLREIVAANLKEKSRDVAVAETLVEQVVEEFANWVHANEPYRFGSMIARSKAVQQILELIARVAQTDTSVLIDGESGTGKELVARAIHEQSKRADKPFVVVNCGAMPETLLESELFGHVRGAFTGATSDKKGLFEVANGGTIFLDEIGETSLTTQVKLLRFLQEGEIKPVGSNDVLHLDVRVLTATNRDLESMVEEGTFRQDLFYRLNVIQITVPPLRERREDVLPLAEFFVKKYARRVHKTVLGFDREAARLLLRYHWPGNVRQLENVVERAVALCSSDTITAADLPPALLNACHPRSNHTSRPRNLTLKELEKRHIAATLKEHNWNYELVSRLLGIGRTTLWRKMKEYGISNS